MDPHYSAGLDGLLKQMQALAEADPAAALSLPREVYTSPELFKLESRKIFRKEWICVGRADEIPNTGDYFTTESIASRYSLFGKATATLQQCLTCAGIGWPPSLRVRATRDDSAVLIMAGHTTSMDVV